jgi:hypothetical protein
MSFWASAGVFGQEADLTGFLGKAIRSSSSDARVTATRSLVCLRDDRL